MNLTPQHASAMAAAPTIALLIGLMAGGARADALPQPTWNTLDGSAPLIIGHRGASGYRPEHTLAGYDLAITLGANYIEPDLVMTQDGVLVARHEPMIGGTTDVSQRPEFASRKTTRTVDGQSVNDWFVQDFTLVELKTLRAIQTRGRATTYDGQFQIPTLDEVITLAKTRSSALGRPVGIYPELKHSTYMQGVSLAQGHSATYFEDTLVSTLHAAYGNTASAPVFIQSFEVSNLQYLNTRTDIKLVQLVDADDVNADGSMALVAPYDKPYDFAVSGDPRTFADLLSASGVAFVKSYADAIGPWKPYLVKTVDDGVERNGVPGLSINDRRVDGSKGVIEAAHAAGLLVHTWTFRNDASQYGFGGGQAGAIDEMAYYIRLGVDGVFTDFADTGVAALAAAAVPEPQGWALMLGGVALLAAWRRRRA